MLPTILVVAFLVWLFAIRPMRGLQMRVNALETAIADLKLQLQWSAAPPPGAAEAAPTSEDLPPQALPAPPTPEPQSGPEPQSEPEPQPTSVPVTPAAPPAAAAAAPGPSLEEWIGTRWAVWVGGAALAVGGIFLVNYSIEAGLLGPTARVVLGALFALALVAAGEWMRRGERSLPIDIVPAAHIPGILTAAGTVVLFGTIYAAYALYGLIGPAAAFLLLGAAGIATMLASALHGPALAGIGLLGAMATPLLVSSTKPSPWTLVVYLAVVSAAALALARLRGWLWLALASVMGVVFWGLLLAQQVGQTWNYAAYVHALIQLGLTVAFLGIGLHPATPDARSKPDPISALALGGLTLLVVAVQVLTAVPAGTDAAWLQYSAVAIALLAWTAWRSAACAIAAVFAGLVVVGVALWWQGVTAPPPSSDLWPAVGVMRLPYALHVYFPFVIAAALAVAAVATLRLYAGRGLPVATAGLYAAAATLTPLLAVTVTYLRITQFDASIPFAMFGVLLAAVFAQAADVFNKQEGEPPAEAAHVATGAFAAAAIAAMAFALAVWLGRGYLTVALALAALGTAYVSTLKRIPVLRYAVAALGGVVLARVAWDPSIMGADVGSWPILNWLLIGYGVPAAAFALSARLLRPGGEDAAVRIAESLAVIFCGLLAFFEIRHLTAGGHPLASASSMLDQGLMTFASLGLAAAMLKLDLRRANPVFAFASYAYGWIAGLFGIIGLVFAENPLIDGARVEGGWLINDLIPSYLLPALMALYLARVSRGVRAQWYSTGAAALAFVLAFLYVTLSVRHLFHPDGMRFTAGTTDAEQWAYSVAWLGLGLLLLAYGAWRGSVEARLASGVLVLLVTLKVFLFDLGGVTGLWRALSFICLGSVLIGIGLVYQRLLFARPRAHGAARLPEPGAPAG